MTDFVRIARRSMRICVLLIVADLVVAFLASVINFSPISVLGDALLFEVAALFVLAGLFDLGSSIGMAEFKKIVLSSKEEFSASKRRESEQHVIVFILAGAILFAATILLTVYDLILRPA